MRWTATLAALIAAVGLTAAQQPPTLPDQYQRQTQKDLVGQAPADGAAKVCVYEPQKTTKTVYTSVCKEYCAADYSPLAILRRCCGLNNCDGPCPPEPLVKRVLVKKTVPGPDKMVCTLKELPLACPPGVSLPSSAQTIPLPQGVLPPTAK
jgi:hypothetical protein